MRPYRSLSWTDLLAHLLPAPTRDELAWAEALQRLQGYARAALPPAQAVDPERVADVASKALTKLYQAPDLLTRLADPKIFPNPSAYLATVVYNAATDYQREQARQARRTPGLPNPQDLPDPHESPQLAWERGESAAELRALLANLLDPADWDLLRQRFWEDRTLQDIAASLDVPYHTAAMRLHRLQQRLLELLRARQSR